MAAARYEHFQVVKYLIEQCEADPNIVKSDGQNALHWAAFH
jgi:ankyrin repeat protein